MGGPGGTVATRAFQDALSKLSSVYGTVYGESYLKYTASGGWGFNETLTISRGGQAIYARGGRMPITQKQVQVPVAQMNALVTAIDRSNWSSMPSSFPGPRVMDGIIANVTVYNRTGHGKTVQTQSMAKESKAFQAVQKAIRDIETAISTPQPMRR